MVKTCKHKGVIVIEDIAFTGNFCHPYCWAYEKYTDLYQKVVRRRGGDPNIGPKLPGMLRTAGAEGVQVNVVQPAHLGGDGKYITSITMERIADSLVSEGLATDGEVEQVIEGLNAAAADAKILMGLPRIFQTWGRRP